MAIDGNECIEKKKNVKMYEEKKFKNVNFIPHRYSIQVDNISLRLPNTRNNMTICNMPVKLNIILKHIRIK